MGRRTGFDFHINTVIGSDSNDGSREAPFATLAHTIAQAAPNQSIGIAAGSNINEGGLDLRSLNGLTLEGYGDFATSGLPIIRSEAAMTGWQTSADRGDAFTNVYSIDLPIFAAPDSQRLVPFTAENGTVHDWVDSVANANAAAGSFHVTTNGDQQGELTAGTWTFFVHPVGGTDPRSDNKTYTYTNAAGPVFGNDITLQYLEFGRQLHRNGCRLGLNATVRNVFLNQVHGCHSLYAASGLYEDVFGWQDFVDRRSEHIGLEFYVDDARGLTGIMRRCVFVGVEVENYLMYGIGGHAQTNAHLYDSITIEDCATRFAGINTTATGWAGAMTLDRVHVDRGEVRLQQHTTSLVRDLWGEAASDSEHILRFYNFGTNVVTGMRAYGDCDFGQLREIGDNGQVTRSVLCADGDPGTAFMIQGSVANNTNLLVDGVIFDDQGGDWNRVISIGSGTLNAASDNNVYSANPKASINGTVSATLANLQANENTDANSVQVDPQLADPANGDFTAEASGLPADSGLERFPTYTAIPTTVAAARAQAIAA
ncbi:MAG: hypothetical protein AAF739_00230 [Pseudomonadota bacterium]